jgi:AmmeMemoRadiSam system protein B
MSVWTGSPPPRPRPSPPPLGEIELDRAAIAALLDAGLVIIDDRAHAPEHSLEVELPFLQHALGQFRLIPLLVGDATPEQVTSVIGAVMNARTLLVVSTDLSHYLDDASARARDLTTAQAIERFDFTRLGPEDACGFAALNGALCAGNRQGWCIKRIDLRNSGDATGDRARVVGYGAWSFNKTAETADDRFARGAADHMSLDQSRSASGKCAARRSRASITHFVP